MECQEERSRPPRPPPPTVSADSQSAVRSDTYSRLKRIHDEAYEHIDRGLSLDEQGSIQEAIECYVKGLVVIEQALGLGTETTDIPAQHKDTARKLLSKMTKSKLQIESRLESLRPAAALAETGAGAMDLSEEQPPSYEEATSTGHTSFLELGDSLYNEESAAACSPLAANATELYSIPEGVQIFYITPEGFVSAPSYPSALRAYKFEQDAEVANPVQRPPAFLQVGDWFYPLVPGVSPALHASYGAYIFPDVGNPYEGSSVGVILPDTVSPADRQRFEDLMESLTAMHEQEEPISAEDLGEAGEQVAIETAGAGTKKEEERVATKISHGITVAAEWMSWGVGKGAEKAGEMIRRGSAQLRSRLTTEEKPREIPEKYQKGVERARQATHVAVTASGFLVNKLGQATMALGRYLAPHVKRHGQRILPRSFSQKSQDGHSKMDDFVEVAASGLHGFGTVYMGLEAAAKALARNLANETVQVVNHKYGADAAKFADHTLYATGNLAMTGYNVNHLGVKAIAKRAAKDTGKAVLLDHKRSKEDPTKSKPSATSAEKPLGPDKGKPGGKH
ncbi:spartin-like [Liolophura sinensis]|uniref:spartin-like n=1 Tax=Liolophura sinensis TaxID=3198878 RepID=UPI003158B9F1